MCWDAAGECKALWVEGHHVAWSLELQHTELAEHSVLVNLGRLGVPSCNDKLTLVNFASQFPDLLPSIS